MVRDNRREKAERLRTKLSGSSLKWYGTYLNNLSSRIGSNESKWWEEQERVEEKIEVVEVRTKVVSYYITVSQLVPRDTLFNYGLRGATPMEGNFAHPLLLRDVHNTRNLSPIVRIESWKDKKCRAGVSFLFLFLRDSRRITLVCGVAVG